MEIILKLPYEFFCGKLRAANYCSTVADLVQSYTLMGCNMALKVYSYFFLDFHLDFFTEYLGAVSDFTRRLQPWKSGTKASGVPECWLIIAGNLETFHR